MEHTLYQEIADKYYLKNYVALLWDGDYMTVNIRAYNEKHLLRILSINFSDYEIYSYGLV